MDMKVKFDWAHVSLFVAVADCGSLSGAARATGVSQPTIGRAVRALEEDLDVVLFTRHPKGLNLTKQGETLIFHARAMAHSAARLSLSAAGRSNQLVGTVRITASQIVATYVLPSILTRLRRAEPRIQVELVATDNVENLLFREADIAIRMVRPTQQDLIARHVTDMPVGTYASHSYLAERPAPETVEDMLLHSLIGYDRSTLIIDGAAERGIELKPENFSIRCDDQAACWQLVLAGAGIGFMSCWLADSDDRVMRLLPEFDLGVLPVWLTSHGALKTNQRVRFVYDYLAAELKNI